MEDKTWRHYSSPTTIEDTVKSLDELNHMGIRSEDIKIAGYGQACYIYYYGY